MYAFLPCSPLLYITLCLFPKASPRQTLFALPAASSPPQIIFAGGLAAQGREKVTVLHTFAILHRGRYAQPLTAAPFTCYGLFSSPSCPRNDAYRGSFTPFCADNTQAGNSLSKAGPLNWAGSLHGLLPFYINPRNRSHLRNINSVRKIDPTWRNRSSMARCRKNKMSWVCP